MEIKVGKKGIIWGYLAQFFSVAAGLITLPVILSKLSSDEIALNYLMLTIGSFVTLLDFGFAPQFGRNITYIFSGVQNLKKEGIELPNSSNADVSYSLLATVIMTAKFLYRWMALAVIVLLLTFGTYYIYIISDGFTLVDNIFIIWIIYCISMYFNVYYAYFSSLLNGKGLVTEHRKSLVYSKLVYVLLVVSLLYWGCGLISVVVASFISPFIGRYFSKKYFFTDEIKVHINRIKVTKHEINKCISILWRNSSKLGIVYIGNFGISKASFFLAGLYLSKQDVASFGLMTQLVNFIAVISMTISALYQPRIVSLKIKKDKRLISEFAYTLFIFVLIFFISSIFLVLWGNYIITFFRSNALLPSTNILIVYCIVIYLEINYSIFTSFIIMDNKIPYLKSILVSGILIILFSFVVLKYTDWGIWGMILSQGVIQASYNNWKWPYVVCKEFKTSYFRLLSIGCKETLIKLN